MTNEAIANAIRSRFKAQVADLIPLPTQYDNQDLANPDNATWCRLTIKTAASRQVSIGNPSAQRYRTHGVMIAQLFAPLGSGVGELRGIADKVVLAFRGKTDGGVTYASQDKDCPSVEGGWQREDSWQINVVCPFYADDIG